jgi:hypothetical protein
VGKEENMSEAMGKIQAHYEQALSVAVEEMERLAIAVMNENETISSFCNGMGEHGFYRENGDLARDNLKRTKNLAMLGDLYGAWDECLKISGYPLRIERKEGKLLVEYDW